jgi:hypothetical protein
MTTKKSRYYAILTILLLTASAISLGLSTVNAQDESVTVATYAFIAVSPNPAGVGQNVYVTMFLSNVQPTAGGSGGARFHDYTVDVTDPAGQVTTYGPYTADPVSAAYFVLTPNMVGDYTLVFKYPGEFTPAGVGVFGPAPATTWLASQSDPLTLTVQQEALPVLTGNPSPSTYWTRPINNQNYWVDQSNNWLMPAWDSMNRQFDQGSEYVPYGEAPDAPHILWTKPLTFGGTVGGALGNAQFHDGRSYEQFFKPPVVIAGRLYYNKIIAEEPMKSPQTNTIECVDMIDGSTLFTIPNATLSFGQIYNYVSPNQAGALAYLWETSGTTWRMFDAWTGQYMLTIEGVPSGTILLDSNFYGESTKGKGDILVYSIDSTTSPPSLVIWNATKCIPTQPNGPTGGSTGTNAWQWRPASYIGSVLNATGDSTVFIQNYGTYATFDTDGTELKVPLEDFPAGGGIAQVGYDNKLYVCSPPPFLEFSQVSDWVCYDMTTGAKLYGPTHIDVTSKFPENGTAEFPAMLCSQRQIQDDILPLWCKESVQFFAWNLKTGEFLYETDPLTTIGFKLYNWQTKFITPDGYLYNWGFDGYVHAYDLYTGEHLWDFSTGDAGLNTPYGVYPVYNGITVMDGKMFARTSDHGNGVEPLYQGEGLYAIDYKTGEELWNITGWWEQPAIADGKFVTHNCYDNQIYCFGKGPSEVTVTASPAVQAKGTAVLISGTVEDISPGAKAKVATGEFNIVPCVSDASMNQYMNYIYQQQECPANVQGVPVKIEAFGEDGSYIDIATVTSNAYGDFVYKWTPPNEGVYTVMATFGGSNSYWSSYDATYLAVGPAAAPSGPIQPEEPTAAPLITAEVAIIIAVVVIAVVGIVAYWALRKRK